MNVEQQPDQSAINKMIDGITVDMLTPLIKLSDSGELPMNAYHWQEIRGHVKQQVAAVYFGTHERLPKD